MAAATFRFGRFELNPVTRQLLIDNQPASLGARAFDVLLTLIERGDRLVTKSELLDAVWPGLVVEENNLQVQISALRKLLGSQAIATIPGRGYRFAVALDGAVDGGPDATVSDLTPAPAAAAPPEKAGIKGERRQLTILFSDLVGATALSGQLDPEVLHDLLLSYQRVASDCVDAYGGSVRQYLGDGVVAYFGYPAANDNDAERAVLSGLALVAAVGKLSAAREARGEIGIQARVGIHTGLVVIGAVGAKGSAVDLAVGEAPNLAARIEGEAAPNSVCISAATRSLLGPQFKLRELEPRPLRGVAKPTAIFAVESGSDRAPDWEAGRNLMPLVGRDAELQHLLHRWQLAKSGHGQAVLISGEAGLGKSRLLAALRARIVPIEEAWRSLRCSPFYASNALHPIIDLLERAIDAEPASVAADRARTLGRLLSASGIDDSVSHALIASLLGLGDAQVLEPALAKLTPMQRRQRTLDTLIAWLLADASKHPTVIVVEDLHWIDPSSRDLFAMLLERITDRSVLLVMTFRPDFVPPWPLRAHVSTIALSRLASADALVIARSHMAGLELPAHVVDEIVRRTDGVPLFVEELTKAIMATDLVVEREGALHVAEDVAVRFDVPASLRDSLTARLDRLGTAKEVAQLASVLGREFDYPLLHAVCEMPEAELEEQLAALSRADIVQQSGMPPHAQYRFKHALLQEAAYDTLLNSARVRHHRRAAEAYVNLFPQVLLTKPELAAHHFGRASMPAQAVAYWQKAGLRAAQRSAYVEAVAQLRQGLALLDESAETPERLAQELSLQSTLGPVLIAAKGWGAADTHAAYFRTRDLSVQLGKTGELFRALRGIVSAQILEGKLSQAQELGEQLLSLAGHDPQLLLEAHNTLGFATTYLGESTRARLHLEQTVALHSAQAPRADQVRPSLTAQNPSVAGLAHLAFPLWVLGFPDQAMQRSEQALQLSRDLAHPFSIVYASCLKSMLHSFRREGPAAEHLADDVLRLCREHGFSTWWVGNGLSVRGWALAEQGETAQGIDQLAQGIAAIRAAGIELVLPYYLDQLASAYGASGEVSRGLQLVDEALRLVSKNAERLWEPELYRQKGELQLRAAGEQRESEAEANFLKSLDLAGQRQAKSWELRSATSLARLWHRQGGHEKASRLLAGVYGWFTEGQETRDLQDAKTLLAQLAAM